MLIEAEFVIRESKKGNEYEALELTFPSGYKKLIFLDEAEKFLLKLDTNITFK